MADPYVPFGYIPPQLGRNMRPAPQPPLMIPPLQPPTAEGGLMPQSGAEAADLAEGMGWLRGAARTAAPFALAGPMGGAIGMAGRAATAAPRVTAALAGGAALATPAATQQQPGRTATQRQDRIRELNTEIANREKTLEKFATRNFQSKTARETASKPHLDAIEAARAELKSIRSGADAEIAAATQAAADKAWNESAITQRYPWLVPVAGTAGYFGGTGLAASIARNAVRRYNANVGELNTRWGGAVSAARNARTQPSRDAATTQAESFRDQFRDMTSHGPRTGGATFAPVAGTEIGVGLPTLADEWMAYSTPHGSPAREHSRAFWSDPASIAGRFAPGILAGGATGKVAGMAAKRNISAPLGYYAETAALPRGLGPQTPISAGPTPMASAPPTIAPPSPLTPLPQPGQAPGLATLGTSRPAQPQPFESTPAPAPRGTRQAEGPPEGAVWNPTTQRWHHQGRMIGGANRWPAPPSAPSRDWRDYPDE